MATIIWTPVHKLSQDFSFGLSPVVTVRSSAVRIMFFRLVKFTRMFSEKVFVRQLQSSVQERLPRPTEERVHAALNPQCVKTYWKQRGIMGDVVFNVKHLMKI